MNEKTTALIKFYAAEPDFCLIAEEWAKNAPDSTDNGTRQKYFQIKKPVTN